MLWAAPFTHGLGQGFLVGMERVYCIKQNSVFHRLPPTLGSSVNSLSPFMIDSEAGSSSIYLRLRQGCSIMSRIVQCKLEIFAKLALHIIQETSYP